MLGPLLVPGRRPDHGRRGAGARSHQRPVNIDDSPRNTDPSLVPYLLGDGMPAAVSWLSETPGFRETVRATLPDG